MTLHAERAEPLGDEDADPAEPDDADGLLVELDAGVLDALPLPLLQRRAGGRDVPGGGEQQADGQLGGADDVGGRRVDDHDAGLGGLLDVDVVEADTGAGDDLEPARRRPAPRRRPWWRCARGSRRRRRSPPAARRGRRRCSGGSRSRARAPRRWPGSALRRSGRRAWSQSVGVLQTDVVRVLAVDGRVSGAPRRARAEERSGGAVLVELAGLDARRAPLGQTPEPGRSADATACRTCRPASATARPSGSSEALRPSTSTRAPKPATQLVARPGHDPNVHRAPRTTGASAIPRLAQRPGAAQPSLALDGDDGSAGGGALGVVVVVRLDPRHQLAQLAAGLLDRVGLALRRGTP